MKIKFSSAKWEQKKVEFLMELSKEVVQEHAARIIADLGIQEEVTVDGIVISDKLIKVGEGGITHGHCEARYTAIKKGFFTTDYKYNKGTLKVSLYPCAFIATPVERLTIPYLLLKAKKADVKRQMIHTLAHELRHAWQYASGEMFEHFFMGKTIGSYEHCWEEQDANEYASSYLKRI